MGICLKNKPEQFCVFWNNECSFNGTCQPVVEECKTAGKKGGECNNIEGGFCKVYAAPAIKWLNDKCPMTSDRNIEIEQVKKINPLKASKRRKKGMS